MVQPETNRPENRTRRRRHRREVEGRYSVSLDAVIARIESGVAGIGIGELCPSSAVVRGIVDRDRLRSGAILRLYTQPQCQLSDLRLTCVEPRSLKS